MGRPKKDAKYLNVYISKDVYDDFADFCHAAGQPKSVAAERALMLYMQQMAKLAKGQVQSYDKKDV